MTRDTQLSYHQNIQGQMKGPGDLVGDRHPSAREGQDHALLLPGMMGKFEGQEFPGLPSVLEASHSSTPSAFSTATGEGVARSVR